MKQSLKHGTIYLMAAQLAFVASGYVIHIGLGRFLGPADYGIYAVVISLMTMVNLILATGIPQAVAKYVAHENGNELQIKRTAEKLQVILSIIIFAIYYLFAYQLAIILNDVNLAPYIRRSSLIVPAYALQALYIGYFNGLKEYSKQSFINSIYSVLKVILILSLAFTSYGLLGAIDGFILASVITFVIGYYFVRKTDKNLHISVNHSNDVSAHTILEFAIPIVFYSVATNLIMNLDLLFVKAHLLAADAGIYSAVSTISKVPFFIIAGIYGAIFPAISNISAQNDRILLKHQIYKALKYTLLILIPSTVVIVLFAQQILYILFSTQYIGGAQALSILTIGMGFFGLFSLFTTIINGVGKPRISMLMSVLILIIDVILNMILIPIYGISGASMATSIACLFGLVISILFVNYKYRLNFKQQ